MAGINIEDSDSFRESKPTGFLLRKLLASGTCDDRRDRFWISFREYTGSISKISCVIPIETPRTKGNR